MNNDTNQKSMSWQQHLDQERRKRDLPYGDESADLALIPNPDLPLGQTVVYQTVSMTSTAKSTATKKELDAPVNILSVTEIKANGPAEGVMLTHEQAWRMKGVTLGRLLHSTTLAPGEVTQIAVTGWQRKSRGQSSEDVAEQERQTQAAGQERSVHDITSGVANETTMGKSATTSSAAQSDFGAGGSIGIVGGSGGMSVNSAVASSVSANLGARDLSADSKQAVRQTTQQHASDARGSRSELVQEAGQSESEQFQTRVVANYNHMHTLNMMYYEVLQVYELSTKVTDAQRCIFIPMQVMEFNKQNIIDFAAPLARAALAMGRTALALAIASYQQTETQKEKEVESIKAEIVNKETEIQGQNKSISGLIKERDESQKVMGEAIKDKKMADAEKYFHLLGNLQLQIGNKTSQLRSSKGDLASLNRQLQDKEEALKHEIDDMIQQLNEQKLAFNQALWSQLDATQVAAMLAGKTYIGVSLTKTVDPNPIAVYGNYVGFRWNFTDEQAEEAAAFRTQHLKDDDTLIDDRDVVVVPTGGVFAEAVPGRANSAEKIDLRRHWKWDKDTIPILPASIAKLHQVQHAQRAEAKPGVLGTPAIGLQSLPNAPAMPGHQLATAIGASVFRDLSGAAEVLQTLQEAQKVVANGSKEQQQLAQENLKAFQDHLAQMAPMVGDMLKKQAKKGGGAEEGAGATPTDLGGLQNALGGEAGGLDVGSLLGEAAELIAL